MRVTQPVKLSRERWKLLLSAGPSYALLGEPARITLAHSEEIDGVTFLPAEYMPGGVDEPHGPPRPEWRRYSRGDVLNLVPPYPPCA